MANDSSDFLGDALAAPLGNLISAIGEGVGEAQAALDQGSLQQTLDLYSETGQTDAILDLLKQVGYQPTFYAIPEVKVKAKVSLALTQSGVSNTSPFGAQRLSRTKVYGTPMNASITNRYNANLNASAELEFTIKPVPPTIEARVAPDLVGKTFEEAAQLLETLGLGYSLLDENSEPTDLIATQEPVKNTAMRVGGVIELG